MAEGRFVLVYHEDLIANFPTVWDDDRLLATWLRLLALADKLWPTPAELPRAVSSASVKALADAGLIGLLPKHRFIVRGLDSIRRRRKDAATNAANRRWGNAPSNAAGNAPSNAKTMPTRPDQTNTRPDQRENGSKDRETDAERLARYRSLRDDASQNADIRYAAMAEVERLEALARVN